MKSLDSLKKSVEKPKSINRNFLRLKDGDSLKIRFIEELAEDGKNFNSERGTAKVVGVHQNPLNYRRQLSCSADQGQCWACEQAQSGEKGWWAKKHLLANVIAEVEKGKWEVRIFDAKFTDANVGNELIEFAETYETITDRTYKYSRKGANKDDTNYMLIPVKEEAEPEFSGELYDLGEIFFKKPYVEQEAFFLGGDTEKAEASSSDSW